MDAISEMLIPLIADGGAKKYNPICVYGDRYQVERFSETVQLACLETNPGISICCLSGESFLQQHILSIRGGYEDVFRKRIRAADMLIFTNVEQIQGKESCMWEFFSLFDHYYEQGKIIVVGSAVPYAELHTMEDRVLAQLQGGLVVELKDQ